MPLNEIENHPFLNIQEESNDFIFENIRTLIIGTFPIYEITISNPILNSGVIKKLEWSQKAYFKYFYGSKKNYFWNILCQFFEMPFPNDLQECISILNRNGVFLTDTISSTYRNEFDSADSSLFPIHYNSKITEYVNGFSQYNLQTICFTSDLAKSQFCEIVHCENIGRVQDLVINGKSITLKTLPSPAGNGRTVKHYFNTYPLSPIESQLRNNNQKFANAYRNRVYFESI